MSKKILIISRDLKQKYARGIYKYTNSIIHAIKETGNHGSILTDVKNQSHPPVLLKSIYNDLNTPEWKKVSTRRLIKTYLKNRYLKKLSSKETPANHNQLLEEKLWYLNDIDSFLNSPSIYSIMEYIETRSKLKALDIGSIQKHGFDIAFTGSPISIRSSNQKLKIFQTVHDLIPMNVSVHNENAKTFYQRLLDIDRYADRILCVSHHTKNDFLNYFPKSEDRVQVIYQPIPSDFASIQLSQKPGIQSSVLKKFQIARKQYFFYVGAIEARKNIHRLIDAFRITENKADYKLIIAGSFDDDYIRQHNLEYIFKNPFNPAQTKNTSRSSEIYNRKKSENIIYIGSPTEIEKLALLSNARAFVFPTLSEGFGIPLLEAQTMGAPVITTNTSAIPEVVEKTALLIQNPFDIEEIANNIQIAMDNPEILEDMAKQGKINSQRFSKSNFARDIGNFVTNI